MGKGDRRKSLKMKQRRARAQAKARGSRPKVAPSAKLKPSAVEAPPEAEKAETG